MQVCNDPNVLALTPNINVLRTTILLVHSALPQILLCTPHLRYVEVQTLICFMWESEASQTLEALRSLPQNISWRPLDLHVEPPGAQSIVLEICAALDGTPLAQAVSKLTLQDWDIEPPIAALRASFPNVLHFELIFFPQGIVSLSHCSSLGEAITAWPMLHSVTLRTDDDQLVLAAQQHLEAAARTVAERKAEEPFRFCIFIFGRQSVDAKSVHALVAAIQSAGGGKVYVQCYVRWERG